jgi:hypothetical protein
MVLRARCTRSSYASTFRHIFSTLRSLPKTGSGIARIAVMAALSGVACPAALALPPATFGGVQSVVPTSVLDEPGQIAVDASGNLYIADAGNHRVGITATDNTMGGQATTTITFTVQ